MRFIMTLVSLLLFTISVHASGKDMKKAYFAGGCFWGVEYYLEAQDGVASVVSGFMGGFKEKPTYEEVVYTKTGHIETVEVVYDASVVSFKKLAQLFFEIHDFTQVGGQGPDIGERYESYIFFNNEQEKKISQNLINILKDKEYKVATKLKKASKFYNASDYHQDYYVKHKSVPYCHAYTKIFDEY